MASVAPSVNLAQGYPLEIFEKEVDEKFRCNFCRSVLKEPVQSFCGHRFCKACIESHVSTGQQIRCIKCSQEDHEGAEEDYSILDKDQMFPDNAVRREMAKLRCLCRNSGCQWTGLFKNYEEHSQNCQFRLAECPQCGERVRVSESQVHLDKYCPRRIINCKYCNAQIQANQTDEHLQSCPKQPIKCEACKKKIKRDMLQYHMDKECSSTMCPAGCGLFEKSKIQEHMVANAAQHMGWFATEISTMKLQVPEMRNEMETKCNDNKVGIEALIQQFSDKIIALEAQITDLINNGGGGQNGQNLDQRIRQAVELQQAVVNDRCQALEVKTGTFEGIASALHRELDKTIGGMEKFDQTRRQMKEQIDQNVTKLRSLERTIALKDINIAELELRVQSLEYASYDGTFVWKVPDFSKKQQDAIQGRSISIYSPYFYTSRRGFKMCSRLYPNGDGMGKGSHLSLFFVVMRGQYDALQNWPFKQRVTFCLVNQNGSEHVLDSFRPDPSSSSFKRPTTDMNIASGCPLFIRLEQLMNVSNGFIKDDTIFIKVTVDTNDLTEPLSGPNDRIKVAALTSSS